jgi:hypothetical protein
MTILCLFFTLPLLQLSTDSEPGFPPVTPHALPCLRSLYIHGLRNIMICDGGILVSEETTSVSEDYSMQERIKPSVRFVFSVITAGLNRTASHTLFSLAACDWLLLH